MSKSNLSSSNGEIFYYHIMRLENMKSLWIYFFPQGGQEQNFTFEDFRKKSIISLGLILILPYSAISISIVFFLGPSEKAKWIIHPGQNVSKDIFSRNSHEMFILQEFCRNVTLMMLKFLATFLIKSRYFAKFDQKFIMG